MKIIVQRGVLLMICIILWGVLAYGIPGKYITLLEGGGGQVDRGAYDQLRSRSPRQEVGQQARHQADRQVRNLPLPVHCL